MRRGIDQFPFSRSSNCKCSSFSFPVPRPHLLSFLFGEQPDLFQEVSDLRRCPLAARFCVSVVGKLSHTLALNLWFYLRLNYPLAAGNAGRIPALKAQLVFRRSLFPPYGADCWIDTFVPCVSLLDLAKAVSFTRYYVGLKKKHFLYTVPQTLARSSPYLSVSWTYAY